MTEDIDLEQKKQFVKKYRVFSPLNEEEIEILANLLMEKHFRKGETIVFEGDPVDSVYLVVKGQADVRHVSIKDNKEHVESVAKLGPEDSIGLNETGFYSLYGRRTATVVALEDMVTLRLSVAAFHGFALAYSHVSAVMRQNAEDFLGKP